MRVDALIPTILAFLLVLTGCTSARKAGAPHPTAMTSALGTPSTTAASQQPAASTSITTGSAAAGSADPSSKGFFAVDTTWVSTERGWALGSAPCATPPCTSVLGTRDGGRSWAALAAPRAFLPGAGDDCSRNACMSSIRFANEEVGWAFGPDLFVTVDGGRYWSQEPSPPIAALETADGRVLRLLNDPENCGKDCEYHLEEAAVGASSWRALPSPPLGGGPAQLILEGSRIYVAVFGHAAGGAEDAHALLVRSLDRGRTWRRLPDPCGEDARGENDAFTLAAAPDRFLAVLCLVRGDFSSRFMVVSENAGRTWSPHRPLPQQGVTAFMLAAASPRVLSVWLTGDDYRSKNYRSKTIATSRDGGRSWSTTLTLAEPSGSGEGFLGYQDDRTGRAFYGGGEIWTTRDGGLSWTSTKFGS
jgi:photosystem II stability/assembly factor-like uncharacterized protein